jgi:hypothetical protein
VTISSLRGANAMQVLEQSVVVLRTKPKAPIHPAISFAEQFWIDMQASLE